MRNRTPIPDGTRFGRLVVLEQAPVAIRKNGTARRYLCRCDCGTEKVVDSGALRAGLTQSCGCLHRELLSKQEMRHGHSAGGSVSTEYASWKAARARCENPKNPKYSDYGGRGITFCERWKLFDNFIADMGLKPSPSYSIERKNVNGNYEPGNCIWATAKVQANNQRTNVMLTLNGKTQNMMQWSEETGIPYTSIIMRLRRGWSHERTLTEPVKKAPILLSFRGQSKPATTWAKELGIHHNTVDQRLKKGWSVEDALTVPPIPKGQRYCPTLSRS